MKIIFPGHNTDEPPSIGLEVYPYYIAAAFVRPKWWWFGKEGESQSFHWRFGLGFVVIGKHAL